MTPSSPSQRAEQPALSPVEAARGTSPRGVSSPTPGATSSSPVPAATGAGWGLRRRLGAECRPMSPAHREAVRAAQPARLLSRMLVARMTPAEAEVYRSCRRTTRLSITDSLRIAGRSDLIAWAAE